MAAEDQLTQWDQVAKRGSEGVQGERKRGRERESVRLHTLGGGGRRLRHDYQARRRARQATSV